MSLLNSYLFSKCYDTWHNNNFPSNNKQQQQRKRTNIMSSTAYTKYT